MATGTAVAVAQAGRITAPKRNNAARLFGYDVFISFALGSPPRGTRSYASDLARRLRDRDITVFFSEDEAPVGEALGPTLEKALKDSRFLIVVVNKGTLTEPGWVRKEVEEFLKYRASTSVVPIFPTTALATFKNDANLDSQTQEWLPYKGRIWVDESDDAVEKGEVSDEVIEKLTKKVAWRRANVKWRGLVGTVFAVLIGLLAVAVWFERDAKRQQGIAERNSAESWRQQGIAMGNAGEAKYQEGIAVSNAIEAKKQQGIAEKNARESRARELAAYATESLSDDPGKSVLLGAHAVNATVQFGEPPVPAAENTLHLAILSSAVRLTLRSHNGLCDQRGLEPGREAAGDGE